MQAEQNVAHDLPAGQPGASAGERGKTILRDIAETIALFLVVFTLSQVFLGNFMIEQVSAVPNFMPGERILVDKVLYKLTGLNRGDMIVGKWSSDPTDVFKRVVGLPGERVEIRDSQVFVNGARIEESYLLAPGAKEGTGSYGQAWQLGAGEYFVMGDNRIQSGDSRRRGPMQAESIVGRAWLRYWPFSKFALVQGMTYAEP